MDDDQNSVVTLKVRVTPEFREKIVETAKENNRSMNAEIVHRLEESFEQKLGDLNSVATEELMKELTKRFEQLNCVIKIK